jgi:hypothetical protein
VHFPSGKEELEGAVDVVAPFPVLGFTNGSSSRDITRGLPQAWEASSERLLPGTLSLGCFRASSVRKAVVSLMSGSSDLRDNWRHLKLLLRELSVLWPGVKGRGWCSTWGVGWTVRAIRS